MDGKSVNSNSPVRTEWGIDPTGKRKERVGPEQTFGEKLNRMSGVSVEKDLYKKDDTLSKEAFLNMTMEQLKYQDPFNPVKNEQFTQQMAMLSQLEQQVNMNSNLKALLDNNKNMQLASLQLVGKHVEADTARVYHDGEKFASIGFKLPEDVSQLRVLIQDTEGNEINSINVGASEKGVVNTKWDGRHKDGHPADPGTYSYKILAKDYEDNPVTVATKIEGRVTGVTTSKGVTFLLMGEQKIGLNDVQSIHEPKNEEKADENKPKMALNDKSSVGTKTEATKTAEVKATKEEKTEDDSEEPRIVISDGAMQNLDRSGEVNSLTPLLFR